MTPPVLSHRQHGHLRIAANLAAAVFGPGSPEASEAAHRAAGYYKTWKGEPVTGVRTCQLQPDPDLPRGYLIHLVRSTRLGTPGPLLCGTNRFGVGAPGWSVGGGVSGPGVQLVACAGCVMVARRDFPGLTVPAHNVGASVIAAELDRYEAVR